MNGTSIRIKSRYNITLIAFKKRLMTKADNKTDAMIRSQNWMDDLFEELRPMGLEGW
ncbi:hypothetical protein GCM10023183_21390 [Nibribacter koreensis]|uniref:Transposase n=1 Tax=Nibribacter koreensis TaxID=1084519 RepID=A0ABP8FL26_9BACT